MNILLQILDDGRVTDAHGRVVSFENTIIVMTTNAGSQKSSGVAGFGKTAESQNDERTMKALEEVFRPEFINRVDEIITFNSLTVDDFKQITRLMLGELKQSLAERGVTFGYDEAAVAYLTKKSYSLKFGARNLRRLIQKEVEDAAAAEIISRYDNAVTMLTISAADDRILINAV